MVTLENSRPSTAAKLLAPRTAVAEVAIKNSGNKLVSRQIEGRGTSLVTTRAVRAGEELLLETPTVWMHSPGTETTSWSCSECMAQLGSPCAQLQRLGVASGGKGLPGVDDQVGGQGPVRCLHCEDEWYCSEAP
jgi:hypothetical protein